MGINGVSFKGAQQEACRMRHLDLGERDDPVLLFGGPYSNAQALAALLQVAQQRQIAPQQMICTGDVVAYCGAPMRTLALMRGSGAAVLAGNCEVQLGHDAMDCGCGFAAGSACDLLSPGWYGFAAAQVSAGDKAWMANCPEIISFTHHGARYGVIHGGVSDIAEFIFEVSPEAVFAREWQALEHQIGPVDHVIAGHCGIPFLKDMARGRWINAGVIGLPPHDGRQQTRYAILDGGEVQFQHLRYDVAGAVRDMQAAGLPEAYQKALRTGYWPSEDVLPSALRFLPSASG
ncbi:MAG: putative phosphodiesterase [Sulfitobacter sp.]|jgi:predicted phosphodiesterase